jgi:hypothetical protein
MLKAIIVDDEKGASQALSNILIAKCPNVEIVAVADSFFLSKFYICPRGYGNMSFTFNRNAGKQRKYKQDDHLSQSF